jgi:adenylate cyclase
MEICFRLGQWRLACAIVAKPKTTFDWRFLFLLPIPALWCVVGHLGWLQFLEHRTIDWRIRYRGEMAAPVKVVYVDVDSRSIDEIGNWPWSRSYFARVSDVLINVAHVRAVGFDFVFSTMGQAESADRKKMIEGDLEFGRFLVRGAPVVLGASFTALEYRAAEGRIAHRMLPLVAKGVGDVAAIEPPEVTALQVPGRPPWTPPNIGLIDTLDGGIRTVPVWAPTSTGTFYHTAVQLARLYWGLPVGSIKVNGDHLDFVWPDGRVQARVPLRDGQLVDINWFSKWSSPANPRESFSIVYNYAQMLHSAKPEERETAEKYFAQESWKDAVVLVGPVDPLLQDIAPTPMDDAPVPRVGVHGNLLKTIISGDYLHWMPEWMTVVIALVLTVAVAGLPVSSGARSVAAKIMPVLIAGFYIGTAFQLFKSLDFGLPITVPVGSAFTTGFAALVWQVVKEQQQKGRIKGLFGTYLSPELVNRMVESGEDPHLGGHEAVITAYFSDIQAFSTFSEKMTPARLVELMNEYLTACTDIVQEEGGTLDKYIGDAVVAMFGAPLPLPDHALRACVATQRVQLRIAELREKWRSETDSWPEVVHKLRARLGLNTGPAIIGNMGSRTRFSYTMMGDNVNLAARMESGAKLLGVYTMVTDTTKAECEKHGGGDRLVFRYLDRIVVKGRSQPVAVHEIVGFKENIDQRTFDCLGVYAQGIERYLIQDWDGAGALFGQSVQLEPNQPHTTPGIETNPSLVLIQRCQHMRAHPPGPGWDGTYVMKEK